jgi:NarL family two-component system response regulator LiaR
MLAATDEPGAVTAASAAGAAAFVAATIDPGELPSALLQAAQATGFRVFGSETDTSAGGSDAGLSTRELEILRALASGRTNKQIANQMWLAEPTVKFHLNNIYRKIGVTNRTEAVRYAYRHGLLQNPALEPTRERSSGAAPNASR